MTNTFSILIIDDDTLTREMLQSTVESQGHSARLIADARLAHAVAHDMQPDVILLDIMMPFKDGYSLCTDLKADPQTADIPVIFLSALYESLDKARAFAVGGADYLSKPFDIRELAARIGVHGSLRRLRRQLAEQNERLTHEIAERRRVEQALRESEERYRSIVEDQHELIVRILPDGTITFVNEAYSRAIGRQTADELLGSSILEIYREPANSNLIQSLTAIEAGGLHVFPLYQAGGMRWHEWQISTIRDAYAQPIEHQLVGRDISDRVRAAALLRRQEQALAVLRERQYLARELHDSQGQVLGYVNAQTQAARDFLAAGRLDLAKKNLEALSAVVQHAQADVGAFIRTTAEQEGQTILLADAPGFLGALDEHIQWQSRFNRLTISLRNSAVLSKLTLTPMAELQLLRIIQESLSNIRRHAGVHTAELRFTFDAGWLQLEIRDAGKGFDLAGLGQQPAAGERPRYGLRSMRGRAEDLGGSLAIETTPGQGTTVVVRVPVETAVQAAPLQIRVLLVDDSPLFLQGLLGLLRARGFDVVGTAESGERGVALARQHQPDIVLMDVELAGISGLEAARQIRAELPAVKIVMLTVMASDELLLTAMRDGAAGYLLKGFSGDELSTMLLNIFQGVTMMDSSIASQIVQKVVHQMEGRDAPGPQLPIDRRQRLILTLVSEGYTYKEIGRQLGFSESTIKYAMRNVMRLLGIESRAAVAAFVREQIALGLWERQPEGGPERLPGP